ncbi:Flp pilus assembly protein CpaB [Isoptericola sp. NPDC055881]
MNRRLLAALVAVVLAVVGGVLLLGYVGASDSRAMAGMRTTDVLVVTEPIPAGAAASVAADRVTLEELPAKAVADGALTSLDQVAGQEVVADLVPGEQLVAARFAAPAQDAGPHVPKGMQEVSVLLETQRVVGSTIAAGDTVGVFVSKDEPAETHLTLHKVLVTRVQGGITPAAPQDGGDETAPPPTAAPEGSVMITFALTAHDAETVVWAQEHGRIWLSLEPADARQQGTRTVTEENVDE